MGLEPLDLLNGTFSLIFVVISTLVGLIIVVKYFKTKNRTILWVGLAWILIVCPWWPSATSAFVALATGKGITLEIYLLLGNLFVPLFLLFFVGAFTEIYFHEKQKIILLIFIIYGILFEIYLIYFVIVDPSVLGDLKGVVDIEFKGFLRYYLISSVFITLIIGVFLALNSLKSEDPVIKLRGRFLLAAFISFTVGSICDASVPLDFITLPLIRILLISSAIEFYFGFIMPDWIKKIFLKEE